MSVEPEKGLEPLACSLRGRTSRALCFLVPPPLAAHIGASETRTAISCEHRGGQRACWGRRRYVTRWVRV